MGPVLALHVLAAVVWVGGMFFAYLAMRPAVVQAIDANQRPLLWRHTLSRFFLWVWVSVITLLVTGYGMLFGAYGGMAAAPWHIHAMQGLGIVMMLLFLHVYFAPYRRLKQALEQGNAEEGNRRVGQIRRFVGINLVLGLIVVIIATAGRYY